MLNKCNSGIGSTRAFLFNFNATNSFIRSRGVLLVPALIVCVIVLVSLLYNKPLAHARKIEIVELKDLSSVKDKIDKDGTGSVIFVDVDDTILTPKSKMFRSSSPYYDFIEQIKKERDRIPDVDAILSSWRLTRKVILVSGDWPRFVNEAKKSGYSVYALTRMTSGAIGNIEKMEEWCYQELKSFGITFSSTYRNKAESTIIPASSSSQSAALFYNGIFLTGDHDKHDVIKTFLESHYPSKIILIDDRKSNVMNVAAVCRENNIDFLGIIYRGIDLLLDKPDSRVVAIQKDYLLIHHRWLEDDEAEKYLE